MQQKRRQGRAGIQSTPSFQILLAEGSLSSLTSLLHQQAKNKKKTSWSNSSNLATRWGKRERERRRSIDSESLFLYPFSYYTHSFLNHLNLKDHFNLIQQRVTKHGGPPLLHLHAKADPHHSKLIKNFTLRSAFFCKHQHLHIHSIASTGRFDLPPASFSPLRRITLNWFEVCVDLWKEVQSDSYTHNPSTTYRTASNSTQPAVSALLAFKPGSFAGFHHSHYQLALRLLAPEHNQAPPEAPI